MRVKLTDAAIRALQPGTSRGDTACPGLRIPATPKGVKSFAFNYCSKVTGKVEWLTIGRYPHVPLAQAREIANDARKTVAHGGTPLAPKIQRTETEKKLRRTPTSSRSITTPS
jgi:hypothetical protein